MSACQMLRIYLKDITRKYGNPTKRHARMGLVSRQFGGSGGRTGVGDGSPE